jgi:hypothetical protein
VAGLRYWQSRREEKRFRLPFSQMVAIAFFWLSLTYFPISETGLAPFLPRFLNKKLHSFVRQD